MIRPHPYQMLFPLLQILLDGNVFHVTTLVEKLTIHYKLGEEEKNTLIRQAKMNIKSFDQNVQIGLDHLLALNWVVADGQVGYNINYDISYRITRTGARFFEANKACAEKEFIKKFDCVFKREIVEKLKG
jgi:hypothetical protein